MFTKKNIRETYKIQETIGSGQTSIVKKCKNRKTKEKFAVKVIPKNSMTDDQILQINNEMELLRQIDHPNIIKLYDVYECDRFICLVTELMEGGELFDQIVEKKYFKEEEARQIIRTLLDALEYCHSLGILHRDIKPENLLIKSNELGTCSVKIADFGLARTLHEGQQAETVCGTPGYVAPEVLKQKPYGKECDYWSIGVVAYIMLSGVPPFYSEDTFKLFDQIINCEYDFNDKYWSHVSREAKDFISKILVKDPKKRMNPEQMLAHPWMNQK